MSQQSTGPIAADDLTPDELRRWANDLYWALADITRAHKEYAYRVHPCPRGSHPRLSDGVYTHARTLVERTPATIRWGVS